jgi:hypothetical protein
MSMRCSASFYRPNTLRRSRAALERRVNLPAPSRSSEAGEYVMVWETISFYVRQGTAQVHISLACIPHKYMCAYGHNERVEMIPTNKSKYSERASYCTFLFFCKIRQSTARKSRRDQELTIAMKGFIMTHNTPRQLNEVHRFASRFAGPKNGLWHCSQRYSI